ncbi:MAG: Uma2 family endonuclease [Polyangiaceae bacterium]|nr:Uma2 family endonuclease [Polyangiaceae bacterium]
MASVAPVLSSGEPSATVQVSWPDDLRRWYLPEEDEEVGTSWIIFWLRRDLLKVLQSLAEEEGHAWFIGAEQDMLLRADDLRVGVRPDGYILPGTPQERNFERWPAYDPSVPAPIFAFELVSESNWEKDYLDAPEKYTALGVNELMVVDPLAAEGKSPANPAYAFQLYRKGKGGRLERVYAGPGPVFSEETGVWWRLEGGSVVLSRDKEERGRILTREEKNRKQAEAETLARQAAEEEKQKAEEQVKAERTARQAAERLALEEARGMILDLCEVLAIEVTPERRAHLDSLDLEGLRSLRASLKTQRAWRM